RSMDGGSEEIINASLASSVTGSIQSDLEDGEYLYRIYAIDDEDHESVAGSVAVVIDSTPPESPIVLVEKHGPTSNVVTVSWASTEIGVT
ncbi:hypothetical protein, partial [Escherichia coli]|uniref:hypothetical protein n=1 Tax=Escherichia coli TaxID=562 RepID=UPI003F7E5F13